MFFLRRSRLHPLVLVSGPHQRDDFSDRERQRAQPVEPQKARKCTYILVDLQASPIRTIYESSVAAATLRPQLLSRSLGTIKAGKPPGGRAFSLVAYGIRERARPLQTIPPLARLRVAGNMAGTRCA